ncbi:MAG: GntR family transcriptional regulator [Ruminococcaceae bacterium]|nr:GntR family transcriptional regulator [Oscillospiraceae bacterium]
MLTLNYRDSRPIYEQIRDGLKRLIVSGAMAPDEKLPSVRVLAQQLSINPNTIQRAYNELENEGFIYSVPGKGSFACAAADAGESRKRELEEKLRELAAELRYLGVGEEELAALIKEEPVKLVTEVLGGPQAETGKEESV